MSSSFSTDVSGALNKAFITKPPNTWVTLARFEVGQVRFCLTYKVPYDNNGVIELRESGGACDHYSGSRIAYLDEVKDVKIFYTTKALHFDGLGGASAYSFYLTYSRNNKKEKIEVPLIEIKGERDFKRYGNVGREKFLSGVSFRKDPKKIFSEISGKYIEDKAQLCHKVSKNCIDTTPNECSKCPNGWYEVVDYNCKQGGTKYCAPSFCGEKGEPACVRGYEFTGTNRDDLCIQGSPAGYCRPGLNTYCDDNKILVCL